MIGCKEPFTFKAVKVRLNTCKALFTFVFQKPKMTLSLNPEQSMLRTSVVSFELRKVG